MAPPAKPSFRFLDLPKEIRLVVYERLPIKTRHLRLRSGSITFIARSLPVAILGVCRQIHEEALCILGPKLYQILSTPPRIAVTFAAMKIFVLEAIVSALLAAVRCDSGHQALFQALSRPRPLGTERRIVDRFVLLARLYQSSTSGRDHESRDLDAGVGGRRGGLSTELGRRGST
ncbi:hypothetical protein BU26DRAFT_567811 [Trematosphaeria pertusa]|uniref:F-box domain-containing protein n=1 Tax=Trematosphaeria pertusa TaxID=390896 RepID=A0A6A6I9W0_9PLEO|nr:uncharacterized protein BU26DRAFT_567811 [Trematosphaeria pertusa]KAF2246323.1 hypothetical protein BU26DRAFT_567811 [Trematosphaeria pertusa]